MYGLYLLTTRGVTRRQRTVTTNPDGSYTETEDTEYGPFAPVVSAMTQLFGGN